MIAFAAYFGAMPVEPSIDFATFSIAFHHFRRHADD
jgi:hypothetical protein